MKKILTVLLAIGLTACGNSDSNSSDTGPHCSDNNQVYKYHNNATSYVYDFIENNCNGLISVKLASIDDSTMQSAIYNTETWGEILFQHNSIHWDNDVYKKTDETDSSYTYIDFRPDTLSTDFKVTYDYYELIDNKWDIIAKQVEYIPESDPEHQVLYDFYYDHYSLFNESILRAEIIN